MGTFIDHVIFMKKLSVIAPVEKNPNNTDNPERLSLYYNIY